MQWAVPSAPKNLGPLIGSTALARASAKLRPARRSTQTVDASADYYSRDSARGAGPSAILVIVVGSPMPPAVGGGKRYVRKSCENPYTHKTDFVKVDWDAEKPAYPDLTFISPPGCILCDYGKKGKHGTSILLEKNINLRSDFIYAGDGEPRSEYVSISTGRLQSLYVQPRLFHEFVLFVQEASSDSTFLALAECESSTAERTSRLSAGTWYRPNYGRRDQVPAEVRRRI